MSVEKIEEILNQKNSFYRISKPLGTYQLYTTHSNDPIKLEIFQNFNEKGSQFTSRPNYSANLSYSDERVAKQKGIGGMWKGLTGYNVDDILAQAIQEIEDFYNPNKLF